METSIIIILCRNSKGLSYMFFPCQHLSRTTCQLLLHLFSGNKRTENSPMNSLYLSNNMPKASAFGWNLHKFVVIFYLQGSWQRKRPEWKGKMLLLAQKTYTSVCVRVFNKKKDRVNLTELFHLLLSHPCVLLIRSPNSWFLFSLILFCLYSFIFNFSSCLLACTSMYTCTHAP